MGMHRWLLGPLICLILATTSARPPECQKSPSWSINGQQPLAETKGKASMLEALLTHFRSYGMNDLEFIIVNSKLSHSQEKLQELQKRVSFAVYQETDEEEVWSVMEGGKDDMYVYDRCGRLTYFIPFPLSILNESPLVSNAILATYFRSPCGDHCDENKTLEIEEFVKNMENTFEESNETQEGNVTNTGTEQYNFDNETANETLISNNLFDVIDSANESIISNNSDIFNETDYDYFSHNDSSHFTETNETNISRVDKARTFFNNIYRLFFNSEKNNETVENVISSEQNSTSSNITNEQLETNHPIHNSRIAHHSHHKHGHNAKTEGVKKKSDRCLEADYEVCKSWSKKRLLHAQKCCSEIHASVDEESRRACANFGKKRCKKIQSILKCCIKTVYTEPVTSTPTEEPKEATTSVQKVNDVVCCKTTEEGKLCRVLTSGDCEEDEFRDTKQTM